MPIFDCKCEKCATVWEVSKPYDEEAPECPSCGSNFTKTLMPLFQNKLKARDPYDYLNGPIPDSKPIKSFANDRRKGGRNTV
jgi:putative FmdB family regulatory protein